MARHNAHMSVPTSPTAQTKVELLLSNIVVLNFHYGVIYLDSDLTIQTI